MVAITQGVGRRLQEVGKSCSTLAGDDLRAIVAITRAMVSIVRKSSSLHAGNGLHRLQVASWLGLVCLF